MKTRLTNIYLHTSLLNSGICCGYGDGSVVVTVDETPVLTTGEFGSLTTTSFGSCGSNPDTDSPTGSPSKAPSASPSSNPTEVPTGSPSKEVSYTFIPISIISCVLEDTSVYFEYQTHSIPPSLVY